MNPNEEENLEETLPSSDEEVLPESEEESEETEATPSKKSAEARINQLVGKIKEFEAKLEEAKQQHVEPTNGESKITPEMQKAVNYLKTLGFVREDEVDKKVEERVRRSEDRFTLDSEHTRLSNSYNGSDGRPKYVKEDVENFMREKAVYDPEVAYEQLHKTELFDWQIKQMEENPKKQPYVEKKGSTTATRDENTLTREQIAEWMKTPEGRIKYEKNREKILSLMAQGQL